MISKKLSPIIFKSLSSLQCRLLDLVQTSVPLWVPADRTCQPHHEMVFVPLSPECDAGGVGPQGGHTVQSPRMGSNLLSP